MILNKTSNSESDKKIISPEKTQYKVVQEKTVSGDKVFTIVDADDKDRSLSESIKTIGAISPIYFMADGKTIIDGRHRIAECPDYPNRVILKDCTTEDKAILTDLTINCNRRIADPEEKRQKLTVLAEKYGYSIDDIKKYTGLSRTTIDRYYPLELKNQAHSQAGIASGKARALKATQQNYDNLAQVNAPRIASSDANLEKEPILSDNRVPIGERQSQEPTNEEKINALNVEADREQQQLEKLICDAKADLPNDFKNAVYESAFNPARELTQKRLNDCLTVALEVLLAFIEQEGKLQELLNAASERW